MARSIRLDLDDVAGGAVSPIVNVRRGCMDSFRNEVSKESMCGLRQTRNDGRQQSGHWLVAGDERVSQMNEADRAL